MAEEAPAAAAPEAAPEADDAESAVITAPEPETEGAPAEETPEAAPADDAADATADPVETSEAPEEVVDDAATEPAPAESAEPAPAESAEPALAEPAQAEPAPAEPAPAEPAPAEPAFAEPAPSEQKQAESVADANEPIGEAVETPVAAPPASAEEMVGEARVMLTVSPEGATSANVSAVLVPAKSPSSSPTAPRAVAARGARPAVARPAYTSRRTGPRTMPILDYSRSAIDDLGNLPAALGASRGGEDYYALEDAVDAKSPRTLWLHDNSLAVAAGAVLGGLLSRRPSEHHIVRLNLSSNQLGDDGVFGLLSSLNGDAAHALNSVGLGVNGLTDASLEALAREMAVGGALDALTELRIGGNPGIGPAGARALALAMCSEGGAAASKLTTLHLGHTSIGDEGGAALAYAMSDDAHLLSDESEQIVVAAPLEPSALKVLHLSDCGLGVNAASAFATALGSARCTLRELWLGGNPLTADGAYAVADVLVHTPNLEKLWLDGTGMDDSAAEPLAAALRLENSPLSELWIGGNLLTDVAAATLAAAIVESPPSARLRKLWLDHTDALTLDGALALLEATAPRGVSGAGAAGRAASGEEGGEPDGGEQGGGEGGGGEGGETAEGEAELGAGDKVAVLWLGGRRLGDEERAHLQRLAAPEAPEGEEPPEEAWHEAAARRAGGMLQLLLDEPDEYEYEPEGGEFAQAGEYVEQEEGALDRVGMLEELFQACDDDGSGALSLDEFAQLFDHVDESVRSMFNEVDTNVTDGKLTQVEFVEYHLQKFAALDDETFKLIVSQLTERAEEVDVLDDEPAVPTGEDGDAPREGGGAADGEEEEPDAPMPSDPAEDGKPAAEDFNPNETDDDLEAGRFD